MCQGVHWVVFIFNNNWTTHHICYWYSWVKCIHHRMNVIIATLFRFNYTLTDYMLLIIFCFCCVSRVIRNSHSFCNLRTLQEINPGTQWNKCSWAEGVHAGCWSRKAHGFVHVLPTRWVIFNILLAVTTLNSVFPSFEVTIVVQVCRFLLSSKIVKDPHMLDTHWLETQ